MTASASSKIADTNCEAKNLSEGVGVSTEDKPVKTSMLTDPRLAGWAHLATICGVTLGAGALLVSAYQSQEQASEFRDQVSLAREIAQYEAWQKYVDMAYEKPEWASGLDFGNLKGTDRTKYLWFVEKLLLAGEQILWYTPDDYQWQSTVKYQLIYHKSYLESAEFINESFCDYTSPVRKIVSEISDPAKRKLGECREDYQLPQRRAYNR